MNILGLKKNKGMASSSSVKQGTVPLNNVTPEATYDAVVADRGRDLDLHKLFIEVTSGGGIYKVISGKKWKEVTATFVFPPRATNASYILPNHYYSLLYNYEQIYYFRTNDQNPPPGSLQSPSARPGFMASGSVAGTTVNAVIGGKLENGYFVTATMGSVQLRGVLFQVLPQNTVAHQGVLPNTSNN